MSKLFIIRNQHSQYLSKQQEWLDGSDRNALYRTVHRDEAINTVFEVSSRDIHLRAEVLACDADPRGNPLVGEGTISAREIEQRDEVDIEPPADTQSGTADSDTIAEAAESSTETTRDETLA